LDFTVWGKTIFPPVYDTGGMTGTRSRRIWVKKISQPFFVLGYANTATRVTVLLPIIRPKCEP